MYERVSRRTFLHAAIGLVGSAALTVPHPILLHAQGFEPYWVQTFATTPMLSGADSASSSLGMARVGSIFAVVRPQSGPLLYVWNPATDSYCYIDVSVTSPVLPPDAEVLARNVGPWRQTTRTTTLWAASGASAPLGTVSAGDLFEVLGVEGGRLRVRDPLADEIAYLDTPATIPVEGPTGSLPPSDHWRGTIAAGTNVRATPGTQGAVIGVVAQRSPVVVSRWIAGEEVFADQPTWAQLADGAFVYSAVLRPAVIATPPRLPPDAPASGRWIDVNLTHQVAVAYDGRTPVFQARFSSGRPAWETSVGSFRVIYRVEKETMSSTSLLGRDAGRADYRVEDIKWTQYFTNDGEAIHTNYWRDASLFGVPSSHGCLGMLEVDARRFWDWASVGTLLINHHETLA